MTLSPITEGYEQYLRKTCNFYDPRNLLPLTSDFIRNNIIIQIMKIDDVGRLKSLFPWP